MPVLTMEKQKIVIRGNEQIALISRILSNVEMDGSIQVVIEPRKKNRSLEQNSLLWKWYGEIAAATADTPHDVHEGYKRKFLIHQLAKQDEAYMSLLMLVKDHGKEMDRIKLVKMTSTTKLKVGQMSEYMENVQKDAASMGIHLTEPI